MDSDEATMFGIDKALCFRVDQGRKVMVNGIEALERNETWSIEDLTLRKKPINCKWVYQVKYNTDGSVQRYKDRLVIHGDHEVKGFDYNETFAPVTKMTSARIFLFVAVAKGWEQHQMDMQMPLYMGDLEEEVFMTTSAGFRSNDPNKCVD